MIYTLQEDAPEEHRVWEKANPLAQDGGALALNQQQHGAYVCIYICIFPPPPHAHLEDPAAHITTIIIPQQKHDADSSHRSTNHHHHHPHENITPQAGRATGRSRTS